MADETARALDATDAIQIVAAIQAWINGLNILDEHLYLEYTESTTGLGMCIKANGGVITDEDICGDYSAEVPFIVYNTVNVTPDGAALAYKPLNDLGAWFKANGPLGLDIGERRTPDLMLMTRGPMDQSGKDESGNITFMAVYSLTYDEEAE
jgi:hypothetical protein